MDLSLVEENYLKAIYRLSGKDETVSTSAIANELTLQPASVTDKLKKMASKGLINYQKSHGVNLTHAGLMVAVTIVRRHRLWEVFLVQCMGYQWDEVHDVAEQLEHIRGADLTERLEKFLEYPKYDPHGDPIPDADGKFHDRTKVRLSDAQPGTHCRLVGVDDHGNNFLKYLSKIGLQLGSSMKVIEIEPFDGSVRIELSDSVQQIHVLSLIAARNIFVSDQL